MSARPIRTGVLGVGSLGQWHARIYAELEGSTLVGVYDADPDRAAEVAARYGTRVYATPAALCADVDAVSVAVPTPQHAAVASAMLEGGAHVLVEKPITDTLASARALLALAEARGRVLQVGHVERFNPVLAFLEERLTQPRFIEAIRLASFPPPRPGAAPRGTDVSVVLDLMIHDLEILLHLVQRPVRFVHAVGVSVLSPSEDIANARIVFEGGCVANVTASRVSTERTRKIRVFQENAYLSLDYQEQTGKYFQRQGDAIVPCDVPIEKGDALERELRAFLASVRDGRPTGVTGREGLEALALAETIRAAIRSGDIVPCA